MTEKSKSEIPVVVSVIGCIIIGLVEPPFLLLVPIILIARKILVVLEKREEKKERTQRGGKTMNSSPSTSLVSAMARPWDVYDSPYFPIVHSEPRPESVLAQQDPLFGLKALEIAADRAAETAICQTQISSLAALGQKAIEHNPGLHEISAVSTRVKEVPGWFRMKVAERTTYHTAIRLR